MKGAKGSLALALIGMAWLAPSASAQTVTIGSVAPVDTPATCFVCTTFQLATAATSPSYTVPAGSWTITSWSARGRPTEDGLGRLRVFRPIGTDLYRLVAETPDATIAEDAAPSIPTNLPVQPGDVIGSLTHEILPIPNLYSGEADDDAASVATGSMMVGETAGTGGDYSYGTSSGFRVNVSAVLTGPSQAGPSRAGAATCKGRPATIVGTAGDNLLTGTNGPDVVAALDGNDKVLALDGNDIVCGNRGKDRLLGQDGEDVLRGNRGNDTEKGGADDDKLKGNRGADLLKGKGVEDFLGGGKGGDTCRGGGGDDKQKSC